MRIILGSGILVSLLLISSPVLLNAQEAPATEYKLLEKIPLGPGGQTQEKTNTFEYLPSLFRMMIGLAGILAVVMIILGGIKYMSTDAWSEKSEAQKTINNALGGLLLVISSWLILYTINPRLIEINLDPEKQDVCNEEGVCNELPGLPSITNTTCLGCTNPQIAQKPPMSAPGVCSAPGGCGCAYPGPCQIESGLSTKLTNFNAALKSQDPSLQILITEMYPPTRQHQASCHQSGACVDARFYQESKANDPANIKLFIEKAAAAGLRAEYEVTSEARADEIRKATGLSASQVKHIGGITGNHFSVYNQGG